MTRKRHHKDKLYIIPSEYSEVWGGYKASKQRLPFRCLPFDRCALTLLTLQVHDEETRESTQVLGTDDGSLFDRAAIIAWLSKYKNQHPVTGKGLTRKDLFPVIFHKNANKQIHCPITYKVFNETSHIVCNKVSSHVYSKDAIDKICRTSKDWRDLMTGEKFTSRDLVTIQDPTKQAERNVEEFKFIKDSVDVSDEIAAAQASQNLYLEKTQSTLVNPSALMRAIITEAAPAIAVKEKEAKQLLGGEYSDSDEEEESKQEGMERKKAKKQDNERGYSKLYTESGQAASLTSTAVTVVKTGKFRRLTDEEAREEIYGIVKKQKLKGYVTIDTSFGSLKVLLHCDLVPMTCHNFMLHCTRGNYADTCFHRLIPKFMIQGGDIDGRGGYSAFQGMKTNRDEFVPTLRHDKRGILSMANSGIDTNKSGFFILFRSSPHLDDLHSVFGEIVQGLEILDKMERCETDKKDKPLRDIKILSTTVYQDPFEHAANIRDGKIDKDAKIQQHLANPTVKATRHECVNDTAYSHARLRVWKHTLKVVNDLFLFSSCRSNLFGYGV